MDEVITQCINFTAIV